MKKYITRAALWWLGPPTNPKRVKCRTCGRKVQTWRRYADGAVECVPCAEKVELQDA